VPVLPGRSVRNRPGLLLYFLILHRPAIGLSSLATRAGLLRLSLASGRACDVERAILEIWVSHV